MFVQFKRCMTVWLWGYKVFALRLNDLKTLEEVGVYIETSADCLKGTIYFVVADNLAAHGLAGFSGGFRSTYYISADFSSISTLEITTGFRPYIFHDLLEGVVPVELQHWWNICFKSNLSKLENINMAILSFPLQHFDKVDHPHSIPPNFVVKQLERVGIRTTLIKMLLVPIGSKVPRGNKFWNWLMDLKDIVELAMSHTITDESIQYMPSKISDLLAQLRVTTNLNHPISIPIKPPSALVLWCNVIWGDAQGVQENCSTTTKMCWKLWQRDTKTQWHSVCHLQDFSSHQYSLQTWRLSILSHSLVIHMHK